MLKILRRVNWLFNGFFENLKELLRLKFKDCVREILRLILKI